MPRLQQADRPAALGEQPLHDHGIAAGRPLIDPGLTAPIVGLPPRRRSTCCPGVIGSRKYRRTVLTATPTSRAIAFLPTHEPPTCESRSNSGLV